MYGVLGKTMKGETPYDQAAIDTAITQLEESVSKIATVFTPNPKEMWSNSTYGSSQKIWLNKADFDSKIPPSPKRSLTSKARSRMSPA